MLLQYDWNSIWKILEKFNEKAERILLLQRDRIIIIANPFINALWSQHNMNISNFLKALEVQRLYIDQSKTCYIFIPLPIITNNGIKKKWSEQLAILFLLEEVKKKILKIQTSEKKLINLSNMSNRSQDPLVTESKEKKVKSNHSIEKLQISHFPVLWL